MKRCTRSGRGPCWSRFSPSSRAPVPQSRTMTVPSDARNSTHDVFPPNLAVWRPGAAMEPRVPQNLTYTVWVFSRLLCYVQPAQIRRSSQHYALQRLPPGCVKSPRRTEVGPSARESVCLETNRLRVRLQRIFLAARDRAFRLSHPASRLTVPVAVISK